MALSIFDTNNWARIKFEVDPTGTPLRKAFQEAFYSPVSLFFFDGANAKQLRKDIFDGYKSKRKPAADNFYMMLDAFRELLTHTHHVIIKVPGFEADDVIATFVKGHPEMEIDIHSTDRDFCALHRPGLRTPIANLKGVEAQDVHLYKTLCGDTSDSISGIVGFGDKAWAGLTSEHKANWARYFQGHSFSASDLGLVKPSHVAFWEHNGELLHKFWRIIGFFDVPPELIGQHTRIGTANYKRGDEILRELLQ